MITEVIIARAQPEVAAFMFSPRRDVLWESETPRECMCVFRRYSTSVPATKRTRSPLPMRAMLGMPAAQPAMEAALRPPVWEDRRGVLGLVAAVVLGGLVGLVTRGCGGAEPERVAPPPVAMEREEPEEARVLPQDCMARERATTVAPVLERLSAGSRLEVVAEEGGWRKVVLTGGREGWTGPGCWSP